ncbi:SSL2 DNA or RNA helicases of superfamily II [uncultured Caudovirales phage]|uniref:SSL2 DNA or RNA helicases of superfamily II n=1 Tax=uncultured Caudovirales phage TaxID=2100421 RepID=A0A6J5LMS3_9CAUD|nr:SSL2 DNA or RNA helicases of superfamily II [uncultured Caudovirales phage]
MSGKAIITNRIFFKYKDSAHLKELIAELTYSIEKKATGKSARFNKVEVIKNYKLLPNGVISIPQGRQDLIPEGYIVEDRRVTHDVPFPKPKHALREAQLPVFNSVDESCFINAKVGWGKTFTALYIAMKLGQKTLVVTHTTMLRDQWIEEVKNLFGFSPGIIGSSKFDIEDHFIVVGNVQTVTKHIDKISKEFGLVILDEAHHCPATTFSNIIDGMHARYRIGLSGTMLRTDGKHIIFKDYFGPIVHQPPKSDTVDPVIKIIKTGVQILPGQSYVEKVNSILYDEEYQEFIANLAKARIAAGHFVLIAAARVEFLSRVKELIGEDCVLITGESPATYEERKALLERVEAKEARCIAGSIQIFSEGISVNILSCLIPPVPITNPITLEQLIGRVQRLHPDKLSPEVYDFQFSGPTERKNNATREGFYLGNGWKIQKI